MTENREATGNREATENRWRRPSERFLVGLLAAVAAVAVGVIQFRHGIVHLLDTVSYWSGAQAVADGHPFTSRLAPSFSNFDAVEFVSRGGRIPFVDFPVAYPLSAGTLGAVIGVRRAMQLLCVLALAAVAWATVGGARPSTRRGSLIGLTFVGALIVATPTMRCVMQGALSEPLFCAVALWFVISLARFRNGGDFRSVAILGSVIGLLRFIGAPLVLMATWEHHRRHRDPSRAVGMAVVMLAPTMLNAVWAASSGGGHNAGWRGLQGNDISFLIRSVGGWFDARQGDLRRTYFSLDGTSWWSWVVAAIWVAVSVYALVGMVRGRSRLPASAELGLVASGFITTGLVVGMMGFDALVTPDNRLMLPAGVLFLNSLAWILVDRIESSPRRSRILAPLTVVLVMTWTIVAVKPWNMSERFSDNSGPRRYSLVAESLGVSVIVTNDADAMHWDTGIATVYPPQAVMPLTGETVDEESIYERLPCELLEHDGAVVLSSDAFLVVNRELLDAAVERGSLSFRGVDGAEIYLPTESACD